MKHKPQKPLFTIVIGDDAKTKVQAVTVQSINKFEGIYRLSYTKLDWNNKEEVHTVKRGLEGIFTTEEQGQKHLNRLKK